MTIGTHAQHTLQTCPACFICTFYGVKITTPAMTAGAHAQRALRAHWEPQAWTHTAAGNSLPLWCLLLLLLVMTAGAHAPRAWEIIWKPRVWNSHRCLQLLLLVMTAGTHAQRPPQALEALIWLDTATGIAFPLWCLQCLQLLLVMMNAGAHAQRAS